MTSCDGEEEGAGRLWRANSSQMNDCNSGEWAEPRRREDDIGGGAKKIKRNWQESRDFK